VAFQDEFNRLLLTTDIVKEVRSLFLAVSRRPERADDRLAARPAVHRKVLLLAVAYAVNNSVLHYCKFT